MSLQIYQQKCKCERKLKIEIDSNVAFVRIKCQHCGELQLFKINQYKVIKHLDSGGMGSVYLVEDTNQNRLAMKMIEHPDQITLGHFMREYMIQMELDHKNIVKSYSQGCYDNIHYILMDYLEGNSLGQLLEQHGAFTTRDATKIILSVLSGLHYAVENFSLVHRDIKPDNIFLTSDNEVKILDLGLAKSMGVSYGLTSSGTVKGSPSYMPYEQYLETKNVDARADIYGIGATFYHLLCGQMPFNDFYDASITEMAIAKHKDEYIPLPQIKNDLPGELVEIVKKAMAFAPDDRYQSAGEMLTVLLSAYENLPK